MKFDTIVTFVDKPIFTNEKTGEAKPMCRVTLQVPIQKTDKNLNAFGTHGVDYYVDAQYYDRFKSIYGKGAKINVVTDFKPTFDNLSKKRYYKEYIKSIDGVDL